MKVKKEESKFHEFNAHFKYNDLFNELLKIKTEREKNANNIKNKINTNSKKNTNNKLLNNNSLKKIQSRNIEMNNYLNNIKLIEDKNETTEIKINSKINKTYVNIQKNNQSKIIQSKLDNIYKIKKKENNINIPNINYKKNYEIHNNKKKNKLSNKIILNNSIKKVIKDSKNKKYNINIINIKCIKKNYKPKNIKKSKCLTKYNNKDIAIISSNSNNKSYNKMLINSHMNQNIKALYKYRSISRRAISKTKSKSKSTKKLNKNESAKNNIKSINCYKKSTIGLLINNKDNNSNINIKNKLLINLKQNIKSSSNNKKKIIFYFNNKEK